MAAVPPLAELDAMARELYVPSNPAARATAEERMAAFAAHPEAWKACLSCLDTAQPHLLFYACNLLLAFVRARFHTLTPSDRAAFRHAATRVCQTRHNTLPHFVQAKPVELLVAVTQHDFPLAFTDFWSTVVSYLSSPASTVLGLRIMHTAVVEFAGSRHCDHVPRRQQLDLRRSVQDNVPVCASYLTTTVQQCVAGAFAAAGAQQDDVVCALALDVLATLFTVVPPPRDGSHITSALLSSVLEVAKRSMLPGVPSSRATAGASALQLLVEVTRLQPMPRELLPVVAEVGGALLLTLRPLTHAAPASAPPTAAPTPAAPPTSAAGPAPARAGTSAAVAALAPEVRAAFIDCSTVVLEVMLPHLEQLPTYPLPSVLESLLAFSLAQPDLDSLLACLSMWCVVIEHVVDAFEACEGSAAPPPHSAAYLASLTALVELLLDRVLFSRHGPALSGINDEADASAGGRPGSAVAASQPLVDALDDELDDWVATSEPHVLAADTDGLGTVDGESDLESYLRQCVRVVAVASALPNAAQAVVLKLSPLLSVLSGVVKTSFTDAAAAAAAYAGHGVPVAPGAAVDLSWPLRDVATLLRIVSCLVPKFRVTHFSALKHPVDVRAGEAGGGGGDSASDVTRQSPADTVHPKSAEALLDCVLDILTAATAAHVHTKGPVYAQLLSRALACVRHFFSWMDGRLASLAATDPGWRHASEWAVGRFNAMLQAVLQALDASLVPPPESVIHAAVTTLAALSYMSANTRSLATRAASFVWLSDNVAKVVASLPLDAQARILAAVLRLHMLPSAAAPTGPTTPPPSPVGAARVPPELSSAPPAPPSDTAALTLLRSHVSVVTTAASSGGDGLDPRGTPRLKRSVMLLSSLCCALRKSTTPVKQGVYASLQPCIAACVQLVPALLGAVSASPRLLTSLVSTAAEVLRLLCIVVDSMRAQLELPRLTGIVTACAGYISSAIVGGVLSAAAPARPSAGGGASAGSGAGAAAGSGAVAPAGGGAPPPPAATTRVSIAGCSLLRNFLRLMRVVAESRSAHPMVPTILAMATSDGLLSVIRDPAFGEELAPAYCGVVLQVLTVHWRRLVPSTAKAPALAAATAPPPPPPPPPGFVSPEVAARFSAIMAVVLAGVEGTVAPALLRMHLRFLSLLNKRVRLFAFKPFRESMAAAFQTTLLRTLANQNSHVAREDVLEVLHALTAPDPGAFLAAALPAFLASVPWLPAPERGNLVAALAAAGMDSPSFTQGLLGLFTDLAVLQRRA